MLFRSSSGSRFLLECMLREAAIDPQRIHGYDLSEYTHAAVAAYVASGMADVGFGVEPPAHRFGLDFVPLATERYMLVCREADLPRAGVQHAISVLRSTAYQQMVNALPGYRVEQGGEVQTLAEAFPNAS